MEDCITVGMQGAITIPARLREAYGIKPNDKLLVEPTGDGLLLRPVAGQTIELYTDDRIAEFASDEQALGPLQRPASARFM
ncbi:MAG: AbrB/MazE/SpoVT family DNA-binding domain-containing protein [Pirellulales bacterium]